MRKFVISLMMFIIGCSHVFAAGIPATYHRAPAPSRIQPISTNGFTTAYVKTTVYSKPDRNTKTTTGVPAGKTLGKNNPINPNGFTTAFPKDTVYTMRSNPSPSPSPRHVGGFTYYGQQNVQAMNAQSNTLANAPSNNTAVATTQKNFSCNGMTYYENGRPVRCN